jgi:prepilin-type processing-associated H-X9-DG protein
MTSVSYIRQDNKKLATTSTGIDVTGTVTATGTSVFASLDISGDIDVDGTTNLDIVDIDGAVDMASTLAVGGVVTANAGVVVDNITIDANQIDVSSGDLTLDVAGDIILDADGADFRYKDAGTEFLRINNGASGPVLLSPVSDKDFIVKGNDGGSEITALTLDMSEAGAATFNGSVLVPNKIEHVGDADTYLQFSAADDWRVVTGNIERFSVNNSAVVINEESVDMDFRVESNGNANMLFVDGGNDQVGIGGSPSAKFSVLDANGIGLRFGDIASTPSSQTAGYIGMSTSAYSGNNGDLVLIPRTSVASNILLMEGNVGIGTTSPSTKLHIEASSNTKMIMRMSTASAGKYWRQEVDVDNIFYIINHNSTGVYIDDGATSWTAISDENVKENIVELTGALDKVKDFRCVEYNLIADERKTKKIGFIAQDWQEDYSQVVSQDYNGNLGMQYTETIPVLLKAIQEQQTIIESLEARITALES